MFRNDLLLLAGFVLKPNSQRLVQYVQAAMKNVWATIYGQFWAAVEYVWIAMENASAALTNALKTVFALLFMYFE